MYKIKLLLLFTCINICILNLNCCQRNGKIQQKETTQNPNSILFKELDRLLNVGEQLADKRWIFVLKFFNIDSNLYFSFWLQPSFPTVISSQTNIVLVDTNNIFGFNVAN